MWVYPTSRILETINSVHHRSLQDALEDNLQEETQIYVCDINPNMLNVGKKWAQERGFGNHRSLIWVEGAAEALRFEDNSMDGYTIAFGIRNVTHIEKVLAEAYRQLTLHLWAFYDMMKEREEKWYQSLRVKNSRQDRWLQKILCNHPFLTLMVTMIIGAC
ncbi:hypothetical protein CsSME_00048445 [Camellia sinensis var. sinensis]